VCAVGLKDCCGFDTLGPALWPYLYHHYVQCTVSTLHAPGVWVTLLVMLQHVSCKADTDGWLAAEAVHAVWPACSLLGVSILRFMLLSPCCDILSNLLVSRPLGGACVRGSVTDASAKRKPHLLCVARCFSTYSVQRPKPYDYRVYNLKLEQGDPAHLQQHAACKAQAHAVQYPSSKLLQLPQMCI
jgi:hypothetical protein